MYTEFEGHEFVTEVLYQGSVINQHNFMTLDRMEVSIRCRKNCKLYYMTN